MATSSKSSEPLRRSKRARKVPIIPQICMGNTRRSVTWTRTEKALLLEGLKQVGERDLVNLVKYVPTKKPSQIAYYIANLKGKLPEYLENREPDRGNYWIQKLKLMTNRVDRYQYDPLPLSVLLIALCEDLPDKSQTGGIDFKELYQYLFCEMEEISRPKLDIKTMYFLRKSLLEIQKKVSDIKVDLFDELKRSSVPNEWPFSSEAMNPLGFPKLGIELS